MFNIIAFALSLSVQAPAATVSSCETYATRLDGTVVTVCDGSVAKVCDASGACNVRPFSSR